MTCCRHDISYIYGTFRHKLSSTVVGTNTLRQNIWPWHKLSCPIVGTNITRQSIWPRHKMSLTVVGTIYCGRIYRLGTICPVLLLAQYIVAEYTAWAQESVSVAISSVRQEKLRPIGVRSRSVSVGSEVPGKEGRCRLWSCLNMQLIFLV